MELTPKNLVNLIQVLPDTKCWQFTGSLDAYGYGRLYSGNKEVKAHRAFYEAYEGPIPDGKYLQHHLPPERCIGSCLLQSRPSTARQFAKAQESKLKAKRPRGEHHQGRGQLWARNPARIPTGWPTLPGVDGVLEDNGVLGIYPGWCGSGRQLPLVRCASARIDTRRFTANR